MLLMQGSSLLSTSEERFWRQKMNEVGSGWVTYSLVVAILVLVWQIVTTSTRVQFIFRFLLFRKYRFRSEAAPLMHLNNPAISSSPVYQHRISQVISDLDLKRLMDELNEKVHENDKWEPVIDKRNNSFSYNVKCCKPKDGNPLKYLSLTVFECCSTDMLRDFYMDNFYRKEWDKTMIDHEQLQVDESNGTEVGRIIKKFPLLTPREYVLAWRVWEGRDGTYYCYCKECDHPLAPRQKKHVRVGLFRSGWRIRKIPGRDACEIKMVHQEDAGLNVEMAKMVFAKGVWSYVCKMDNALRKYYAIRRLQLTSAVNAITLVQKVPMALDSTSNVKVTVTSHPETSIASGISCQAAHERKLSRRPSNKLIANGLIVVGGVICLSRGHSNFSAKVAMAYILSKLIKRGASSSQSSQASVQPRFLIN